MLGDQIKPGLVNVNRYDRSTQRGSDLYAESADPSHANEYSHVIRPQARPPNRLERSSDRIGDHRQEIKSDAWR